MPTTKAFTLVELLVVIGIIAVLIGILVPVLSKATQSAKEIKCSSQVRQLTIALLQYSQTYKVYPAASYAGVPPENQYWFTLLSPYLGNKNPTANQAKVLEIMVCPEDEADGGRANWAQALMTIPADQNKYRDYPESYAINRNTQQSDGITPYPLSTIKMSSEFILIGELKAWYQWPTRVSTWFHPSVASGANAVYWQRPMWGANHKRGKGDPVITVGYADGHVGHRTIKQLLPLGVPGSDPYYRKEFFRSNTAEN